jgi:hypothetical protein
MKCHDFFSRVGAAPGLLPRYCAAVIDSTRPDRHTQGTEQLAARVPRHDRAGKRARYLPSTQVIEELGRLGPDLSTIADDLRESLTRLHHDPGDLYMRAHV